MLKSEVDQHTWVNTDHVAPEQLLNGPGSEIVLLATVLWCLSQAVMCVKIAKRSASGGKCAQFNEYICPFTPTNFPLGFPS